MVWSIAVETNVCIGDLFRVGPALVQVSEARIPCWKISRRWGEPELLKRVLESDRYGWHARGWEEGAVEAGQTVCLVEAMKLFNEIEAEFKCKIIEILKEDAAPVEFGEPLFKVERL